MSKGIGVLSCAQDFLRLQSEELSPEPCYIVVLGGLGHGHGLSDSAWRLHGLNSPLGCVICRCARVIIYDIYVIILYNLLPKRFHIYVVI